MKVKKKEIHKVDKKCVKEIKEQRTLTYIGNLPLWDESKLLQDTKDSHCKEYLFTGGLKKKDVLKLAKEEERALIYTPKWIVQKRHFFDLIFVEVGKKNVVGILGKEVR